jgi:hypothetical protein
MSEAKVGHFTDKGFNDYVEGSEEYCRGWADGYNLYADVCVVVLVGDVCGCGPDREEMTKPADEVFLARTGCLRCDRWDGPVRLRRRAGGE